MPMHHRMWIDAFEPTNQVKQRSLLRQRPRVLGRLGIICETANIAHTNAMCIMASAMRAHLVHVAALMHAPIKVDHIMVANASEASLLVPPVNSLPQVALTGRFIFK